VLAGVSAATAARPGAELRKQASALEARTHHALLDLYALDTRLNTARARLAALEARSSQLRREEQELAQRLTATRRTLAVSQHALGDNLAMLYKQGDVNALAVVLGSESIDDAVTKLDALSRVADQSRQVVEVTASAQSRLDALRITLADRRAQLDAALAAARETAASLTSARADRLRFISGLRHERRLKTAAIARLEATAARVEKKSDEIQTAAAPAPTETPVRVSAPQTVALTGRTITVSSTGYSLPGRTATGMPVGWGVVAVDPAVIPLGTRLTIPGYGEAVAADTGGAVRGRMIDLWFPTLAQARGWGRRTVTITVH
jgi:3D (Asp-Asp-Asp) domain-containing protein